MTTSPPRPPQVTLAAWLVMIGSGGIVLGAYLRLASLGTLENRDAVTDFLSHAPGSQLGIGVDTALDLIRIASLVAAGCAVAAIVLGREVLGRSRSARIVLSVLAVPLLLTGSTTGGFLNAVVVSSIAALWLRPSRDWFNGITPPPSPSPSARTTAAPWPPPLSQPPGQPPLSQPPGSQPPPSYPAPLAPTTPPLDESGTAWLPAPGAPPLRLPVQARPVAVIWAAILTWSAAGLIAIGLVAAVVVLATRPDLLSDELHRQQPDFEDRGVTVAMVAATLYVMCGAFLLWCVGASTVALLLWRRHRWARTALLISAGVAGGLLAVGTLAAYVLALPLAASIATFVLLRRPEVDRWL